MSRSNDEKTVWGGIYWEKALRERMSNSKCLERYGYKVYSQNDEDGIIAEIFRRIGTTKKTFFEIGVQNGLESNGHLLLFSGWRGVWVEGSKKYCKEIGIRFRPVIEEGRLKICNAFVDRNNIEELIKRHCFERELDFLSIDIDGNDYYVWKAVKAVKPRVVCVEYNGKIPPDIEWKQAYHDGHRWDGSDWQGASLRAFETLGREKGYSLVGTNISGVNAFFVRDDLVGDLFLEPYTALNLYNPLKTRYTHRNGHKARYCLVIQKENMGVEQYVKPGDKVFITKCNIRDNLIDFYRRHLK